MNSTVSESPPRLKTSGHKQGELQEAPFVVPQAGFGKEEISRKRKVSCYGLRNKR